MNMEIPLDISNNLTYEKIQECRTCLSFDISANILYLIFGYYAAVYLGYLLKFAINKGYLNKEWEMDLVRYYLEFSQLVLVLLYFALRPGDYMNLGLMALLVFGSLIIRKRYFFLKRISNYC
jgi:hypothetical protein